MADSTRRKCLKAACSLICAPLLGAGCRGGHRDEKTAHTPAAAPEAFEPGYVALHRSGELRKRATQLWEQMRSCTLCPRVCGVNRIDGEKGFCRADARLKIASFNPHFGEERPLVGRGGSGTIFFSNCSLRCVFCINWEVSQGGEGRPYSIDDLAAMMLTLQRRGCHNINVVTPTHYSAHILMALDKAAAQGLRLPLVYNTCGWEQGEVMALLDGIVDIYLPDFKFACEDDARTYLRGAGAYPKVTANAFLEMHRQVGVARPAPDGLIYRGLMIRHLVMPNRVGDSKGVLEWIGANLPKDSYINIMSQYTPYFEAKDHPDIARRITAREYTEVVEWARAAGLTNLDIQGVPRH